MPVKVINSANRSNAWVCQCRVMLFVVLLLQCRCLALFTRYWYHLFSVRDCSRPQQTSNLIAIVQMIAKCQYMVSFVGKRSLANACYIFDLSKLEKFMTAEGRSRSSIMALFDKSNITIVSFIVYVCLRVVCLLMQQALKKSTTAATWIVPTVIALVLLMLIALLATFFVVRRYRRLQHLLAYLSRRSANCYLCAVGFLHSSTKCACITMTT